MEEVPISGKVNADELFNQYEEIQQGKFKSLHPLWCAELLPDSAKWEDGRLYADVENLGGVQGNWAGFTELRCEIIERLAKGSTQKEIADNGVASGGYASRTKKLFGFLLEDTLLYNAYVVSNGTIPEKGQYVLTNEDKEFGVIYNNRNISEEDVERFRQVIDSELVQVIDYNGVQVRSFAEETEDEDVQSEEDQDEQFLSREEWKEVVGSLYRDDKDELASKVIDSEL